MGVIVVKNAVVRKPGYMYFIDGSGNLCETKMSHKGRKKGTVKKKKVVVKKMTLKQLAAKKQAAKNKRKKK